MRKAYLIYRMNGRGRWTPQIYYDEFYTDIRTQKSQQGILGPYDISRYMGEDNEVFQSFYALDKEYLQSSTEDATTQREYQMSPQPVTGYLTSNGKYFATEWEANLYEQSLELNIRATDAVVALREWSIAEVTMDEFFQGLPAKLIDFININEDLILAYINARQTEVTDPDHHQQGGITLRNDGVGGQTTVSNQDDDSRVRGSINSPVDQVPYPKDDTEMLGAGTTKKPRK